MPPPLLIMEIAENVKKEKDNLSIASPADIFFYRQQGGRVFPYFPFI